MFGDFQNFRGTAYVNDSIGKAEEHAKANFFVQALANHAAVTRLENMQWQKLAREKYDVKRKERNTVRKHGPHRAP
jgi:hypothetical protein